VDEAPESKKKSLLESFKLSASNWRQFKAGAAAVVLGYVALGVAATVSPEVRSLVVNDFSWQHIPFHVIFALTTSTIGAVGIAAHDQRKGKTPEPGV